MYIDSASRAFGRSLRSSLVHARRQLHDHCDHPSREAWYILFSLRSPPCFRPVSYRHDPSLVLSSIELASENPDLRARRPASTMDYLPGPAIPQAYARTYGGNAAFHNFHNDYSHIQDPNLRRRLALSEVRLIFHLGAVVLRIILGCRSPMYNAIVCEPFLIILRCTDRQDPLRMVSLT